MSLRSLLLSACLVLGLVPVFPVQAATLAPGDLIKASGPSVYYYAENGKRYVFPTEKTYFTWYAGFSDVKTITDAELGALMIGGNVTYRPGIKLVKITTDPKVYAVGSGRQLRWLKTEQIAKDLYGADWSSQVDDIPDPFFINYSVGAEIAGTSEYNRTSIQDAHATIQATLGTVPTPSPVPPPSPNPPVVTGGVSVTTSKTTARGGDIITVVGSASHPSGIMKLEVFFDGSLLTSCAQSPCSSETQIPVSGTKESYEAKAVATAVDSTVLTKTSSVAISSDTSSLVTLKVGRAVIKQNQAAEAIVDIDPSIAIIRTDIYLDGTSIEACASAIRQCRWSDLLPGAVGTVYDLYGKVTDNLGRVYLTPHRTITIGTNDSPIVTVGVGKSTIYTGETVDVTVTASDDDGIVTIEILQDGTVIKSCASATPCTITVGPWTTTGTFVFTGRATDSLDLTTTNGSQSLSVQFPPS